MNWLHTILLGILEGITEFLPVSSTGHLRIAEALLGYRTDDPGVTAYTAIIQVGAMIAAIVYFWRDIVRIAVAWFRGLGNADSRTDPYYRLGWAVIVGTAITGGVGLIAKKTGLIENYLSSLWAVAAGLIGWSIVLVIADRVARQTRGEDSVTWRDGLLAGLMQCLALIPGVSRSGATISAGLFSGLDRVTATRLSFFLGIPALLAAGGLEAATEASNIASNGVGWAQTGVGTLVSFIVGYASIAWLLRFVSRNNFTAFVIYRVIVGIILVGLLIGRVVPA